VILPGFDGGGEWGGAAFDRTTGVLYVDASDVPWIAAMRERVAPKPSAAPQTGGQLYLANCASCHRTDR
jgi:quinoprotein glucose dehydrogenase